jgi:hypothetical protein
MTENTSHIMTATAAIKNPPPSLGDDLLRGADAIAEFLFGDRTQRRKVYYLTGEATVRMPHFRLGAIICARKSTLLRWIESHEARGTSTSDA